MVSAQCVLLFFRLNYFSRLFANKFSFLDSLKQVRRGRRLGRARLGLVLRLYSCALCVSLAGRSTKACFDHHRSPLPHTPTPQVVVDCKWYLLFLMLMLYGFALSFYSLFRYDQDLVR